MEDLNVRICRALLPKRAPEGHKGTFGRVCVIGGSTGYTGAPVFAAEAATRTGSGLVMLGTSLEAYPVVAGRCDSAMAFPLPNRNMINVYNALAAVALLHAFGLEPERIAGAMAHTGVSATRYKETDAAGRKVILHLAKGQNPVACSRAFQNIRDYPGKKAAILFLDDFFDAAHTVENISWLYDADFEFLAGPSVTQVVVAGARHWDVYLRLLMAGADPSRVAHMADTAQAAQALDPAGAGAVFILYDVYTIPLAEKTMAQVKERLEKEGGNHG